MIQFKCECGFEREVSDESAGKSVRCPKCKVIGKVPEYAEISSNPEDYADDPGYRPAEGMKAVDRPGRGSQNNQRSEANDTLLGVLFFLKILALFMAVTGTGIAGLLMAEKNIPLAVAALASGLTSAAWTYAGSEAVRLLVQIERNTSRQLDGK